MQKLHFDAIPNTTNDKSPEFLFSLINILGSEKYSYL